MKNLIIGLIKLYQLIPGPWHNSCRHIPTCSEYSIQAFKEYGLVKGFYLSSKRIIKCNPWGTIGYDPLPEKENKKK